MPTSRLLPGRHEASVAATVAALGFPRRSVLALDSGHRLVNAALVGPLRWPRYLILSDGILSLLDPFALRGVVAHEVAHARAGHPALLALVFVVIPLLLLQPVLGTDTGDLDPSWVLVALVGADGATRHEFEVRAPQRIGGGGGPRDLALDAADSLLGEWLEDERPRLPGVTALREYEGTPVQVTARLVLPRLQAEADRLLGESDEDEGGGLDA